MSLVHEKLGVVERVGTAQTGFSDMVIFHALSEIITFRNDPIDLKNQSDLQALAETITMWLTLEDTDEIQLLVKNDTDEEHLISLLQAVRDQHNTYNLLLEIPELVLEELNEVNEALKLVVKRNESN